MRFDTDQTRRHTPGPIVAAPTPSSGPRHAHGATGGRAAACAPPPIAGPAQDWIFPLCWAGNRDLEWIHWIGNGHSPREAQHKQSQNQYEPKIKKVHLRKSTETTQNQDNRSQRFRLKRLAQVEILITPVARIASEIARP